MALRRANAQQWRCLAVGALSPQRAPTRPTRRRKSDNRWAAPLLRICSAQGHPGRIRTVRGMMYDVNISNPVWKVVEPLAHEKLKVVMNYLTYYGKPR